MNTAGDDLALRTQFCAASDPLRFMMDLAAGRNDEHHEWMNTTSNIEMVKVGSDVDVRLDGFTVESLSATGLEDKPTLVFDEPDESSEEEETSSDDDEDEEKEEEEEEEEEAESSSDE